MNSRGYYDDQNIDVEKASLKIEEIFGEKIEKEDMFLISSYIINYCNKIKQGPKRDEILIGLSLKLAKGWDNKSKKLPEGLPIGFPCELGDEAYASCQRLYHRYESNPELLKKEGWKQPNRRMKVLEKELVLFSGCVKIFG